MSRNKSLLEYHLDPYEKGFVFQIVCQSDKVTNYVKRVGIYHASNGWRVAIDKEPEVDVINKVIYLQGRKEGKDLNMHRNMNVGNNKEVKKKLSAIDRALMDLCQDAKGDKRKRPYDFYDQIVVDLSEFDAFAPCCRNDNRILVIRG